MKKKMHVQFLNHTHTHIWHQFWRHVQVNAPKPFCYGPSSILHQITSLRYQVNDSSTILSKSSDKYYKICLLCLKCYQTELCIFELDTYFFSPFF
jgi:hypothetical protein